MVRNTPLPPAHRRSAIIDLLARGLLRLHRRAALENLPISARSGRIRLDSSAEMLLSVSDEPHNG